MRMTRSDSGSLTRTQGLAMTRCCKALFFQIKVSFSRPGWQGRYRKQWTSLWEHWWLVGNIDQTATQSLMVAGKVGGQSREMVFPRMDRQFWQGFKDLRTKSAWEETFRRTWRALIVIVDPSVMKVKLLQRVKVQIARGARLLWAKRRRFSRRTQKVHDTVAGWLRWLLFIWKEPDVIVIIIVVVVVEYGCRMVMVIVLLEWVDFLELFPASLAPDGSINTNILIRAS